MALKDDLLKVSARYCEAKGLSRSRVSTIVFNDGKVIDRIAGEGDMTTGRAEAALIWFAEHWPVDADWPVDVSRPEREVAA